MNLLLTLFTATIFVLLVPGVLFKLPAKGSLFVVALVHGLLFALLYNCIYQYSILEGFALLNQENNAPIDSNTPNTQDNPPPPGSYDFTFPDKTGSNPSGKKTIMPVECVNLKDMGGVTLKTGSIVPDGTTFFSGTFFTGGNVLPTTNINKLDDPLSISTDIPAGTPFPSSGLALANNLTITNGFITTAPIYAPVPSCYIDKINKSERWLRPRPGLPKGYTLPKGTTFAGTTIGQGHILPFDLSYVDANGVTGTIPKDTRFTKMLTSTADISIPQSTVFVQALIYPSGFDSTNLGTLTKNVDGSFDPNTAYNMGVAS
jgi:hypothetical protein